MYLLVVFLFVGGCTLQMGNHNTTERQGPCEVNFAGTCNSTDTDTTSEKSKSSTEGERSHSVDLEAGGQVGDKEEKPKSEQNAK